MIPDQEKYKRSVPQFRADIYKAQYDAYYIHLTTLTPPDDEATEARIKQYAEERAEYRRATSDPRTDEEIAKNKAICKACKDPGLTKANVCSIMRDDYKGGCKSCRKGGRTPWNTKDKKITCPILKW